MSHIYTTHSFRYIIILSFIFIQIYIYKCVYMIQNLCYTCMWYINLYVTHIFRTQCFTFISIYLMCDMHMCDIESILYAHVCQNSIPTCMYICKKFQKAYINVSMKVYMIHTCTCMWMLSTNLVRNDLIQIYKKSHSQ